MLLLIFELMYCFDIVKCVVLVVSMFDWMMVYCIVNLKVEVREVEGGI